MMQSRRSNPRAEYRLHQTERINASATLARQFPGLKSLTVNLEYFDATGTTRNGAVKFKANIEKAKSLMWFNCPSGECTGGDYDLSDELARAIYAGRKIAAGEKRCQGTRHNREKKEQAPCQSVLRYTLRLAYL